MGVAPGQACVFYNKQKKMIGGGWILASEKKMTFLKFVTHLNSFLKFKR